jgi:hypothetical protein
MGGTLSTLLVLALKIEIVVPDFPCGSIGFHQHEWWNTEDIDLWIGAQEGEHCRNRERLT